MVARVAGACLLAPSVRYLTPSSAALHKRAQSTNPPKAEKVDPVPNDSLNGPFAAAVS